ncbi:hypothetical protein Tco_0738153 [Tanacetum coccineum]
MIVRRTSRLDRGTRSVLGSAGAAKRRANWFDMLLKSNIDQNEDHLLGLSTATVAKKIKRTHQEGQANRSRSLKEAVLEESQWSNGGCDVCKPRSFEVQNPTAASTTEITTT